MSSEGLGLVQAGLEALAGSDVVFVNCGIAVSDLHRWLVKPGAVSQEQRGIQSPNLLESHNDVVYVRTLTRKTITVPIDAEETVDTLKDKIEDLEGTPQIQQLLIFAGKVLEDHKSLTDCGIQSESTLHLILNLRGGGSGLPVDPRSLDPAFDFDFTNVRDTGRVYYRGGEIYRRPCGWKRYALAVLGKYGSDEWLGPDGHRESSADGEWPVSYHGTSQHCAKSISEVGFQLSKGKHFAYGHGIYTTPDVDVAAKYAPKYSYEGDEYKIVLQNRVNPKGLIKLEKGYWLTPRQADVRPYGIIIKRI